jgi:hypothetical protein
VSAAPFAIPGDLERDFARIGRSALVIGVLGLAGCALGAFLAPQQFFRSYLWAYMFYIGLTLGCLALNMLQYLTGGAWGLVIRRLLESASRTLPLLAILFVPVLAGIPQLYEWSHADVVARDAILQRKAAYLNVPFFIGRAVAYFVLWTSLAYFLNKWSAEQDRSGSPAALRSLQRISAPGLIVYAFTITLASVDWIMSLNPHWWSTIFGILFMGGQGLSALSFVIALTVLLSGREPLSRVITPGHLHDLGKLMLAFVMLWAYFSFSQLLIIWSGNLVEEVPWYMERLRGSWVYVGVLLVLAHFALPFALLLSRSLKRSGRLLGRIALLVIVMRFVDLFWMVAPDIHKQGLYVHWLDLLAPIGLGGVWLAVFLWQLRKHPLVPVNDPHLEEAIAHGRD